MSLDDAWVLQTQIWCWVTQVANCEVRVLMYGQAGQKYIRCRHGCVF